MIKKSLLLTFVVLAVCILVFGMTGSGAWFTDNASASGAISSGNFDFEVSGAPLSLSNAEPGAGYQPLGEFCVQNNGDYDMKFRGYMKDVVDPGNLRSFLLVKIEIKALNVSDHNTYGPQDDAIIALDVPFTSLMEWNDTIALFAGGANNPDPFAAGMKACYKVSGKLSNAAGNDQIAKTLTATLYFNATQWINAGW